MAAFSRPLIISGPSGTGKSTLLKRLFAEHPDSFGFSVSHTTRNPRQGETPGVSYHYTDTATFQAMIKNDEFIEHAVFSGNHYGTSLKAMEEVVRTGKRPILDIDTQGVKLVKKSSLDAVYLFIAPPSIEDLRKRLSGRGTETPEAITKRVNAASTELRYAEGKNHDCIIVNDVLDRAYEKFKAVALGHPCQSDTLPRYIYEDQVSVPNGKPNGVANGHASSKELTVASSGLWAIWTWFVSWPRWIRSFIR